MFNRVVAYGCSHTAAYETNDIQWHPDADGYKLKHGASEFYKYIDRTYPNKWDYQHHVEMQKSNSFANVLAKLIGASCINNAIPGNSLAQIVWQLETDLVNNQITSQDLILIGLPSYYRIIYFADQAATTLRMADSYQITEFQFDPVTLVEYFNREQVTFLYLTYIKTLLYLEKTKLPGQVFFVDIDGSYCGLFDFISTADQQANLFQYFQKTMFETFQEINTYPVWLDINGAKLYNDNDITHAGKHATIEMHKRYAEQLFKNLKEITHDQYI